MPIPSKKEILGALPKDGLPVRGLAQKLGLDWRILRGFIYALEQGGDVYTIKMGRMRLVRKVV